MTGYSPEDYQDSEAEQLLKHLCRYCQCHESTLSMDLQVSELAKDLAISMDITTDDADDYRAIIERIIS